MPETNRDTLYKHSTPAEGVRAVGRSAPALQTFDSRWLVGIAFIVPVALTAGVYWLHQQPTGSQSFLGGPAVEVRLIREPAELSTPLIMTRPQQEITAGQAESLVEAPVRSIPEEKKSVMASIPPAGQQEVSLDQHSAPVPERRTSMSGGSALAFQRALITHIARYLRYPRGASARQLHGVVHVRFAMRRDGTVTGAWVKASSGHLLLDRAATETIRLAQPLPVIPADLPDMLTISLPVSFDAP